MARMIHTRWRPILGAGAAAWCAFAQSGCAPGDDAVSDAAAEADVLADAADVHDGDAGPAGDDRGASGDGDDGPRPDGDEGEIAEADACVPSCGARECGDDGCGGTCGSCGTGGTCGTDGTCVCSGPGRIAVALDGEILFDRDPPRSLRCLGLHYTTDEYASGPPGARVTVVREEPGLLEADLTGFQDDHENCDEKWGFVNLEGDCADVLLEKWNANPCSPYYTSQLKLETWVDTDGDCAYSGAENDEPYGGDVRWDPGRTYRLRIEWE